MKVEQEQLRAWIGCGPGRNAPATPGSGGPTPACSLDPGDTFKLQAVAIPLVASLGMLPAVSPGADAGAEEVAGHDSTTFVSLTIDNDFFAGFDRHYTNGIQVAFSAHTKSLPESLRPLPPFRWSAEPRFIFSIGQRIYTPADMQRTDPDPLDRPYAGWLYALAEVRARTGAAVDHVQASVGIIGPASMAEQTQNAYHKLVGAEEARGWDAQIGNELGLLLGYERAWPGLFKGSFESLDVDFTPRAGATIGNVFTYASTGMVARFGRGLPDDFPTTYISLGPPRDGYHTPGTLSGWYTWFGTEARLVGWNVFLDGNTFKDSPSVDRQPFVYDLQLGIVAFWRQSRIGFTYVKRSEEFKAQQGSDKFGQLTFSYPLGP